VVTSAASLCGRTLVQTKAEILDILTGGFDRFLQLLQPKELNIKSGNDRVSLVSKFQIILSNYVT
jgi:hypothetical protein